MTIDEDEIEEMRERAETIYNPDSVAPGAGLAKDVIRLIDEVERLRKKIENAKSVLRRDYEGAIDEGERIVAARGLAELEDTDEN